MSATIIDGLRGDTRSRAGNALLWIVGGVFALLLAAGTTLIILAHRHPVETVPPDDICREKITDSAMDLVSINSIPTALVAGLITSLHCLGMCGPLACAVVPLRGDRADAQIVSSIYHLSRLAAYATLGALFGALGRLPMDWLGSGVVQYVPWLLVVFFVAVAFRWDRYLPRVPGLGNIYVRVHGWGRSRSPVAAAAALGLATPLLPCGPLYFVMALAMLAGSALRGVEFMLAFGLGTMPLLWLLQTNFQWIRSKLPASWLRRLQMGMALAAAVVIAWRLRGTLGWSGPGFDHFVCH